MERVVLRRSRRKAVKNWNKAIMDHADYKAAVKCAYFMNKSWEEGDPDTSWDDVIGAANLLAATQRKWTIKQADFKDAQKSAAG